MIRRTVVFGFVVVLAVVVNCHFSAAEEILFESGTLGPTGIPISELTNQNVPGTNITPAVFAGVRFQLDQPVITSQVGGHFVANGGGTFFGAIVELDDGNDFPNSGDFTTDDFLGLTQLAFPTPSDEVFGDLELTLDPGWYALIFGSGLFDTVGSGVAVRNGTDIGDQDYIGFQEGIGWHRLGLTGTVQFVDHRFVVKGQVVPEPSTLILTSLATVAAILAR